MQTRNFRNLHGDNTDGVAKYTRERYANFISDSHLFIIATACIPERNISSDNITNLDWEPGPLVCGEGILVRTGKEDWTIRGHLEHEPQRTQRIHALRVARANL